MKKKFFSFVLMLLFASANGQEHTIEGIIENYNNNQIYIANFYGDQDRIIDSLQTDEQGYFKFSMPENAATGKYRVIMKNNKYFDLVYNDENIRILTKSDSPIEYMDVLNSEENQVFYDYIKRRSLTQYKLELLQPVVSYYPGNTDFYTKAEDEFMAVQENMQQFIDSVEQAMPGSYALKIMKSEQEPMRDPELSAFEQTIYMQQHFFDYVDFSDTSLMRSDVFSTKLIGYLGLYQNSNFTKDQLEDAFIRAVDTILLKTRVNRDVYEFAIEYLIGGFNQYNFNKVLDYIAENSEFDESCDYEEEKSELEKRIETMKKLAIGKTAPDFTASTTSGDQVTLSELDDDYVLLVFWASWCPHCTKQLPELEKFYHDNPYDLEVISVSIDSSHSEYEAFIETGDYNWINICDFTGWNNQLAELYGIHATPTLILLNEDREIIAKPDNTRNLESILMNR
ncbi:MAG: redoxin domain-containing protein [Bacteroidales bacterium]|nr:redoxin domain-containing protein [Bacteroidales bacterium]MCF8352469.1 redoxin domain-containing protein [Bacteroidales bacterium]MCF8375393.1 redoxin domain-containing protein [Bacteroidales bacterium]MCF8401268.1 redoxin domain-containing protein [Bacteroidales bacterium]